MRNCVKKVLGETVRGDRETKRWRKVQYSKFMMSVMGPHIEASCSDYCSMVNLGLSFPESPNTKRSGSERD